MYLWWSTNLHCRVLKLLHKVLFNVQHQATLYDFSVSDLQIKKSVEITSFNVVFLLDDMSVVCVLGFQFLSSGLCFRFFFFKLVVLFSVSFQTMLQSRMSLVSLSCWHGALWRKGCNLKQKSGARRCNQESCLLLYLGTKYYLSKVKVNA